MPDIEQNKNEIPDSIVCDIAKEFNVIVDSVKNDKSDFVHDRYFRFAFAEPKRMAELLTLFSPMTLVALTAMRYIWDVEKFSVSFREAALHLLKMQNTDEGRDFIKQSLSYFFWKWPYKSEVIKMDSPEALKNKGYETFGEHFFNAGAEQERKKFEAEKQKMAEYFRSRGVPEDVISGGFAIK